MACQGTDGCAEHGLEAHAGAMSELDDVTRRVPEMIETLEIVVFSPPGEAQATPAMIAAGNENTPRKPIESLSSKIPSNRGGSGVPERLIRRRSQRIRVAMKRSSQRSVEAAVSAFGA